VTRSTRQSVKEVPKKRPSAAVIDDSDDEKASTDEEPASSKQLFAGLAGIVSTDGESD